MRAHPIATATATALALVAGAATAAPAETVRVLNWSDYVAPGAVEAFEAETGIEVVYDHYDSGEVVERRLLAGGSGYDVVVISSEYLGRLIRNGALQPLDVGTLAHGPELSPMLMERLAAFDPGNRHAVPYLWGTTGIGYDAEAILARDPDAPLDGWSLVFDPDVVAQFADCGVSIVDSPEEVLAAALIHLGHDPNTQDAALLEEAAALLAAISPYVQRYDSEQIWDLALGEICLALGWSTDVLHAADVAEDGREIRYVLPRAGAPLWYDSFVVPQDAANAQGAQAFVDFMIRADNLAAASDHLWAPNASDAAFPLVSDEVRLNPLVYPPADHMASLAPVLGRPLAAKRRFEEAWSEIKLGF